MNNYTEEAKQIYNKVCDKYKHHWLDTTISQTMAMEMITEALSIADVVEQSEQLVCDHKFIGLDQIHSICTKCEKIVRDY